MPKAPPRFEDTVPAEGPPPAFEDTVPASISAAKASTAQYTIPPAFEDTVPADAATEPGFFRKEWERFKARPGFSSEEVTPEEIEKIAKTHGVSPELLANRVAPMGGREQGKSEPLRRAIGVLGEGPLMGAIPALERKVLSSPEEERALDELNTLIEEKKSKAQLGAEFVTGFLGPSSLLKVAGEAAPLLKAAAPIGEAALTGALSFMAESKQGETAEAALTGAAGGAALGGIAKLAGKAIKGVFGGPGSQKLENAAMENIKEASAKAQALVKDSDVTAGVKRYSDDTFLNVMSEVESLPKIPSVRIREEMREAVEFAKQLSPGIKTMEDAAEVLRNSTKQLSPEVLELKLRSVREERLFNELKDARLAETFGRQVGVGNRFLDFMTDAFTGAAAHADNRIAVNMTGALTDFSRRHNKFTGALDAAVRTTDSLSKETKKTLEGGTNRLWELLQKPELRKTLTPEESATMKKWQEHIETLRETAGKFGIKIAKKEDYVPHYTLELPEYILALEKRENALVRGGVDPLKLTQETYEAARKSTQEFDEYVRGVELLTGRERIHTLSEFLDKRKLAFSPELEKTRAGSTLARSALKREDAIPHFLLEKNVPKLLNRWAMNTFRQGAYSLPIAKMQKALMRAESLGDKVTAASIRGNIQRLTGATEGFLSRTAGNWITNRRIDLLRQAAKDPENAAHYRAKAELPAFLGHIANNVYQNTLSSTSSAIGNASSFVLNAIPELGPRLGGALFLQSFPHAMKSLYSGAYKRGLRDQGVLATQWEGAMLAALKPHMMDVPLYRWGAKGMDAIGKIALAPFAAAENLVRATAFEMGERLGDRLVRKDKAAMEYLERLPIGFQQVVKADIAKGNNSGAKSALSAYFQDKTAMAFNKATASEFAHAIGPILAVYIKYPLAVAGDMTQHLLRTDKTFRDNAFIVSKYLSPLMVGIAFDKMVESQLGESIKENPVASALLGAGGLKGRANIGSPFQLMATEEGNLQIPPMLKLGAMTVGGTVNLAVRQDPELFWKALNEGVSTLAPGASFAKWFYQMEGIREGEKRKGTFANRLFPEAGLDSAVRELKPE